MEKVGDRIRLTADLQDPWTEIPAGMTGTITFIDALGTLHTNWDNGSRLGVVPEIDSYEVIESA